MVFWWFQEEQKLINLLNITSKFDGDPSYRFWMKEALNGSKHINRPKIIKRLLNEIKMLELHTSSSPLPSLTPNYTISLPLHTKNTKICTHEIILTYENITKLTNLKGFNLYKIQVNFENDPPLQQKFVWKLINDLLLIKTKTKTVTLRCSVNIFFLKTFLSLKIVTGNNIVWKLAPAIAYAIARLFR